MQRASIRGGTVLRALAAIAGGAWGAVACGAAFGVVAQALGAPTGTQDGEMVPGPGWNRLTAFLVGCLVGLVLGSVAAVRISERWPRSFGTVLAVIGALAVIATLAAPAFWPLALPLLVAPALVWAALRARRRSRAAAR